MQLFECILFFAKLHRESNTRVADISMRSTPLFIRYVMTPSFLYILANQRNGTLYVGATIDLIKRVWEHKNNIIAESFTAKYQVHQLVYYEMHHTILEAAKRERRIKDWRRQWKINLIESVNPAWRDLYDEICG